MSKRTKAKKLNAKRMTAQQLIQEAHDTAIGSGDSLDETPQQAAGLLTMALELILSDFDYLKDTKSRPAVALRVIATLADYFEIRFGMPTEDGEQTAPAIGENTKVSRLIPDDIPTRSELSSLWCGIWADAHHTFIEAAKMPPMTEGESFTFSREISKCLYWADAVHIVDKWREHKQGGVDEVVNALNAGTFFGDPYEMAEKLREIIAAEQQEVTS